MTFASLGLSEKIVRAVSEREYTAPTPIQAQAIPAVLSGRDVMAAAQTGTGKTAGFALPILQRLARGEAVRSNHVRVLVLTPTRELAAQVYESFAFYGKHLALKSTAVFGGVGINPQMMKLRRGVDVLVATPGRLLDLHAQNAVRFSQLETLVLDEADRMLDMGFIRDIRKILALLPKQRQTLLFSATFSDDVRGLAQGMLANPVHVQVSTRNAAAETVRQQLYPVDQNRKSALLGHLIKQQDWQQVLVFIRTRHGANRLARKLERDGIGAAAIHGDKSQGARTRALSEFKRGLTRVLVATDIAARGLDIDQLPQVVNFDLPEVPEDYVHRIGRTGRAGAHGHAVSLVSPAEGKLLEGIERLLKRHLPREFEPGFEPTERLAISRLPDASAATKPHPGKSRTINKRSRASGPRTGNAGGSHGPNAATPELPRKHRRRGNGR